MGSNKTRINKIELSSNKRIATMNETDIQRLADRYPFTRDELQLLVRCHEHLIEAPSSSQPDDFLMILETASPYQHFFLPGDEDRSRLQWLQEHVLPEHLSRNLHAAVFAETFVTYANQGQNEDLERFIEGIANTGRRGTREALRILYLMNGGEEMEPRKLVDMSLRLAVACEAMMEPNMDRDAVIKQVDMLEPVVDFINKSLEAAMVGSVDDKDRTVMSVTTFTNWAEAHFPLLVSSMSTFVHNLLFHEHKYPEGRIKYMMPKLEQSSDIFESKYDPSLRLLSFVSHYFGGTWSRLYCLYSDGQSFNRLAWALLGYAGPTLIVVKTTQGAVLGGFTTTPWKESKAFYGNHESFLFRFRPDLALFEPIEGQSLELVASKGERNFMYLHTRQGSFHGHEKCHHAHGLGFGGTVEHPRFFIPESLEQCSAGYLDNAFVTGNLLPDEALEKFEIADLEVWGVGGSKRIKEAFSAQTDYRERTSSLLKGARTVRDKSQFASDLASGLVFDNKTFAHQQQVRGRAEFEVDEVHGGYKLDHEKD